MDAMNEGVYTPRALFLSTDGSLYSDTLICSGLLPGKLGGKPCPFAMRKQMPAPVALAADAPDYDPDRGEPGDLCPPCAMHHIGALETWEGHKRYFVPEELLPLRLFKCRQDFWLVVIGLRDDRPKRLVNDDGDVD